MQKMIFRLGRFRCYETRSLYEQRGRKGAAGRETKAKASPCSGQKKLQEDHTTQSYATQESKERALGEGITKKGKYARSRKWVLGVRGKTPHEKGTYPREKHRHQTERKLHRAHGQAHNLEKPSSFKAESRNKDREKTAIKKGGGGRVRREKCLRPGGEERGRENRLQRRRTKLLKVSRTEKDLLIKGSKKLWKGKKGGGGASGKEPAYRRDRNKWGRELSRSGGSGRNLFAAEGQAPDDQHLRKRTH